MPKVIPLIPDYIVLTKLDELPASAPLTPPQVVMLTGLTISKLEDRRKSGRPPPFNNDGGRVRYCVEDILAYMRSMAKYTSTKQATETQRRVAAGLGFSSLSDFINYAKPDDVWPIAIVRDKPYDFFDSLKMQLSEEDECKWMTLSEYMTLAGDLT